MRRINILLLMLSLIMFTAVGCQRLPFDSNTVETSTCSISIIGSTRQQSIENPKPVSLSGSNVTEPKVQLPANSSSHEQADIDPLQTWIDIPYDIAEMVKLQESVDNGHRPGLLSPEQVSLEFLSLKLDIKNIKSIQEKDTENEIKTYLANLEGLKVIEIQLIQPVKKDKTGIWVVYKYRYINH